jgi:hypothetical protein
MTRPAQRLTVRVWAMTEKDWIDAQAAQHGVPLQWSSQCHCGKAGSVMTTHSYWKDGHRVVKSPATGALCRQHAREAKRDGSWIAYLLCLFFGISPWNQQEG